MLRADYVDDYIVTDGGDIILHSKDYKKLKENLVNSKGLHLDLQEGYEGECEDDLSNNYLDALFKYLVAKSLDESMSLRQVTQEAEFVCELGALEKIAVYHNSLDSKNKWTMVFERWDDLIFMRQKFTENKMEKLESMTDGHMAYAYMEQRFKKYMVQDNNDYNHRKVMISTIGKKNNEIKLMYCGEIEAIDSKGKFAEFRPYKSAKIRKLRWWMHSKFLKTNYILLGIRKGTIVEETKKIEIGELKKSFQYTECYEFLQNLLHNMKIFLRKNSAYLVTYNNGYLKYEPIPCEEAAVVPEYFKRHFLDYKKLKENLVNSNGLHLDLEEGYEGECDDNLLHNYLDVFLKYLVAKSRKYSMSLTEVTQGAQFVCGRGALEQIGLANEVNRLTHNNEWTMVFERWNGIIFVQQKFTEEETKERESMAERCMENGHKRRTFKERMVQSGQHNNDYNHRKVMLSTISKKKIKVKLIYSGEIDAVDSNGNFVQFKNGRPRDTGIKLRWWLHSTLLKTDYILAGIKNGGVVHEIKKFPVDELENNHFNPSRCFLDLLHFLYHMKNLLDDNSACLVTYKDGYLQYDSIPCEEAAVVPEYFKRHFLGKMTSTDEKPAPIIFGDESISDVTLVVGNQDFKIHKMVLASRSDVFKVMFYGDFKESKEDRIEIKDVSADNFRRFLEIIYSGKITDPEFLVFPFKNRLYHIDLKIKEKDTDKNTKDVLFIDSYEKYFHDFWKNTTEILNIADRFNLVAPVKYYLKTIMEKGAMCSAQECHICFNSEVFGIIHELHYGTVINWRKPSIYLEWVRYAGKEPFPISITLEQLDYLMDTLQFK